MSVYKNYYITDNMFCAGYRGGRIDSCAGDSGTGKLCWAKANVYRQYYHLFYYNNSYRYKPVNTYDLYLFKPFLTSFHFTINIYELPRNRVNFLRFLSQIIFVCPHSTACHFFLTNFILFLGGPLLCQKNNRWTIYGITSFGEGCGRQGKYGIYAKVPNYTNWIEKTIEAEEKRRG